VFTSIVIADDPRFTERVVEFLAGCSAFREVSVITEQLMMHQPTQVLDAFATAYEEPSPEALRNLALIARPHTLYLFGDSDGKGLLRALAIPEIRRGNIIITFKRVMDFSPYKAVNVNRFWPRDQLTRRLINLFTPSPALTPSQ
jgi:hypothetical protein